MTEPVTVTIPFEDSIWDNLFNTTYSVWFNEFKDGTVPKKYIGSFETFMKDWLKENTLVKDVYLAPKESMRLTFESDEQYILFKLEWA